MSETIAQYFVFPIWITTTDVAGFWPRSSDALVVFETYGAGMIVGQVPLFASLVSGHTLKDRVEIFIAVACVFFFVDFIR